jgi:Iap family predicted aminopeptidase
MSHKKLSQSILNIKYLSSFYHLAIEEQSSWSLVISILDFCTTILNSNPIKFKSHHLSHLIIIMASAKILMLQKEQQNNKRQESSSSSKEGYQCQGVHPWVQ